MYEPRVTASMTSSHSESELGVYVSREGSHEGGAAAPPQPGFHRKNAIDFHHHSSGPCSRSRSTSPHDLATLEADERFKPPPPLNSAALPGHHCDDADVGTDSFQHVRRIPFKASPSGDPALTAVSSSSMASGRPSSSPTRRATSSTSTSPQGSNPARYQEVRSITRSISPPLAPAIPIIRRGHFVTMLHKGAEEWEYEQRFLRKDPSKDNGANGDASAISGEHQPTASKSEKAPSVMNFCRTDGEVIRPDNAVTMAWDSSSSYSHINNNSIHNISISDKADGYVRIPTPTSVCESFNQPSNSVVSTSSRLKATGFITAPLAQRGLDKSAVQKSNIQELLRDPRGRLGGDGKGGSTAAPKSQIPHAVVAQPSSVSTLTSRSTSASKYGTSSTVVQRTSSKSPMRLSPNNFAQGLRQSIPSKSPVRNVAAKPFAPTGGASLAPPPLISMRTVAPADHRIAAGVKKKDPALVPDLHAASSGHRYQQHSSNKSESLEKALHDYQETMERLVESYQRGRSGVKMSSIPVL